MLTEAEAYKFPEGISFLKFFSKKIRNKSSSKHPLQNIYTKEEVLKKGQTQGSSESLKLGLWEIGMLFFYFYVKGKMWKALLDFKKGQ